MDEAVRKKWILGQSCTVLCMSMNGGMLSLPTHHRSKYLFHRGNLMTHEFYRQLYPSIIRDIDVSS